MYADDTTQSNALYHLVYLSHESFPHNRKDLRQILDEANHFNAEHQITGMLIYRKGSFLQVLEGSHTAITTLYARICNDYRHHQVQLILLEPADKRYFREWSMGFCDLASAQDRELAAYTTFLNEGLCAERRPDAPSIPAALLTMFVHDFAAQPSEVH